MKTFFKRMLFIAIAGIAFFLIANDRLDRMYAQEQKDSGTGAKVVLDDGWLDVEKVASQKNVGRVVDHELFFLLTGIDARDGEPSRTDTMMLVKANFDKGTIDIISLPRDSYVSIEGEMTKLNHAHAYGGIDLTIQTIRDWLGIDLDYYVEVDFKAVQEIVDAMGGIKYTIPGDEPLHYYIESTRQNKELQPGPQTLNGEQALGFLRYREGYIEGDLGRVRAQQDFMKAAISQALSPEHIGSFPSFVKTYFDRVKTNIPWNEIVGLLQKIGSMKNAKITTHVLEGDGQEIDGVFYYIVDEESTSVMLHQILDNYILLDDPFQEDKGDAQSQKR